MLKQVRKMMQGHTFVGVTRSCGAVQDLTEDDQENVKRGSASRLSGKQRKIVIAASAKDNGQKRELRKRLRERQLELIPAITARGKASNELNKRARHKLEGKHTLKSATVEVMEHAQTCTKFTPNLRETTRTPFGAVTVSPSTVAGF